MGKPIQIPVGGEGGALGVAMVAAVGIGRFATLTEASEAMGTTTTTVEPTADGTKLMQERPEALKGFLRATQRALVEMLANPQAGLDAVRQRDPLLRAWHRLGRRYARRRAPLAAHTDADPRLQP